MTAIVSVLYRDPNFTMANLGRDDLKRVARAITDRCCLTAEDLLSLGENGQMLGFRPAAILKIDDELREQLEVGPYVDSFILRHAYTRICQVGEFDDEVGPINYGIRFLLFTAQIGLGELERRRIESMRSTVTVYARGTRQVINYILRELGIGLPDYLLPLGD